MRLVLYLQVADLMDLLQSLLDSHPKVAQFPAILHFTDEFLKFLN